MKSKKFHREAEVMSKGWGKYLKSIDTLKNKVDNNKDVSLDDACWILYGEGHCSFYWENFRKYCAKNKWRTKLMPWGAWKGLFEEYKNIREQ